MAASTEFIRPKWSSIIAWSCILGGMFALLAYIECYDAFSIILSNGETLGIGTFLVSTLACGLFLADRIFCYAIIDDTKVVRAGLFSRRALPFSALKFAVIAGGALPYLAISAGSKLMIFQSLTLKVDDLLQIQKAIVARCAANSVDLPTTYPPEKVNPATGAKIAAGYLLLILLVFGLIIFLGLNHRHL